LLVFGAGITVAQTTEFTYQGSLKDGANPATGNYDFEFLLFDSLAGPTQLGSTLTQNGVAVANGLFSVRLDFGNQFPGANRFLEIHVRQTGGGAFTILAPRQLVNSAPYSVQSLNAANATSAAQLDGKPPAFYQNAGNLSSGALPDARLAGAYTGALTLSNAGNAFTGVFSGSGAGLTSLNASNLSSGTLAASRLPNPLTLSGTSVAHIIKGDNASTGVFARGVHGAATGASGATIGVLGESASTSGTGVAGLADANTGATSGVSGQSDSTSGRGVYGVASSASGITYGGRFESNSTSGRGLYGLATAATGDTYGVFGRSDSPDGLGVYGTATAFSGAAAGVYGQSAGTSGLGVSGYVSASTGITYGGRFESISNSGRGVYGLTTAPTGDTYGVFGRSDSTNGIGVFGSVGAPGGVTRGVYGQSSSTSGVGVSGYVGASTGFTYGVSGQSISTSGRAVYGLATAPSGITYGGRFESDSTSGRGVYGSATASDGFTYGVYGESDSTSGRGVFGFASAASGITYGGRFESDSTDGVGAYGFAAEGIGVLGKSNSANGYGVFSSGELGATGAKSFRIDHPDDPANKYLLHYAAESPEVINFYRGAVVLDGAGEAVVELPRYFAKINKTPSYQLTAVGAPMHMLHVAEEIDEAALSSGAEAGPGEAAPVCSFRIAGGAPGRKVSWRVEALRNDLWIQRRGAPVEIDKQGVEKGTYQRPELYGLPAEKGVDYDPARNRPKPTRP
jgi:hypothetical protein